MIINGVVVLSFVIAAIALGWALDAWQRRRERARYVGRLRMPAAPRWGHKARR